MGTNNGFVSILVDRTTNTIKSLIFDDSQKRAAMRDNVDHETRLEVMSKTFFQTEGKNARRGVFEKVAKEFQRLSYSSHFSETTLIAYLGEPDLWTGKDERKVFVYFYNGQPPNCSLVSVVIHERRVASVELIIDASGISNLSTFKKY